MTLELTVPSDPSVLRIVRSVVGHSAALAGFAEDEAQLLVLAVDEACANIIRHAYRGGSGVITILCASGEDGIEFVLRDWGAAADSACWPDRSLDEVRPGGLGLPLIRAVMDEAAYRRNGDTNELRLVKRRNASGRQDPDESAARREGQERD